MQCSICKKKAVIFRKHEGRSLCRKHFLDSIDKTVRKTIRREHQIPRDTHIAVDISRGPDSILLLYQLHKLNKKRNDLKISAILAGTRKKTISPLKKITDKYSIRFYPDSKPKDIKADCLALPDNMDDEAAEIVSGYFCSKKETPHMTKKNLHSMRTIKPLSRILQKETALYVRLKKLSPETIKYHHPHAPITWKIKELLKNLEDRHPGIIFNIVKIRQKIQSLQNM